MNIISLNPNKPVELSIPEQLGNTYENKYGYKYDEILKHANLAELKTTRLFAKINEVLRDGGLPALEPEFLQKVEQLYLSEGKKYVTASDPESDLKERLKGLIYAEKIALLAAKSTVPLFEDFIELAKRLVNNFKQADKFHQEICEELKKNEARACNSNLIVKECRQRLDIIKAQEDLAEYECSAEQADLLRKNRNVKDTLSATIIKHSAIIDKCEKDRPGLEKNTLLAAELSTEAKSELLEELEKFKRNILEKVKHSLSTLTCSEEEVLAMHQKIEAEAASERNISPEAVESEAEAIAKDLVAPIISHSVKSAKLDKGMRAILKKDYGIDIAMAELKKLAISIANGETSPEIIKLTNKIKAARPDLFTPESYERKSGYIRESYSDMPEEMVIRFHKEINNKSIAILSEILTSKKTGRLKLDSEALNFLSIHTIIEAIRLNTFFPNPDNQTNIEQAAV